MDAVVAKPYGLDKIVKDTDFNKKRLLEKKLFFIFFELLNEHHKTEYSERFWQILLGHWFRKTLGLLINRINTISECLENYNISGCTFYANKNNSLASLDESSFETNCSDDIWNNFLYHRIINFFEVDFPQAEQFHREVICLPMFPKLTKEQQTKVVKSLKLVLK